MKALRTLGSCLMLALAPALSVAQEPNWRPAGNATSPPSGIIPVVSISRPVPLDDPGTPGTRPVVRGQNPDDTKPLPLGPPSAGAPLAGGPLAGGPFADPKRSTFAPFAVTQGQNPPVMPKAGEFVAPAPQPGTPSANVWGPPSGGDRLLDIGGACGDSSCQPCPTSCCSSGWLGQFLSWFHHKSDPCCTDCPLACPPCLNAGNLCCDPCGGCNSRPRYWVFADYLMWVPQNQSYPPLVTASLNGGTGVLGAPGTVVLFDRFNDPIRSGMRIGGGFWFHEDGCWGADVNYWFLSTQNQTAAFGNNGDPNIGRPFFDVTDGTPKAEIVSFAGAVVGTVNVHQTQQIWGFEANLRRKLTSGAWGWLDLQLGYRHFTLNEGLQIDENLLAANPAPAPPTHILVDDRFRTANSYNGAQIGLASEWRFAPRWTLNSGVRVSMGVVSQTVDIAGATVIDIPGFGSFAGPGGLLTQPSNIGMRSVNRFAVMPELNLKLGYDITPNLRMYVGYDFMYISSVVRPTGQIDLNVNRFQVFVPPPFGAGAVNPAPFPAARFHPQDMWVQGFNAGFQYKY
jgi:hypothetical protein